jgi:phosphoenolpyruvate---glycerone phosphotransferase subunit DhaK
MKKFINDPYDVVDEMLEGFLDVHKKYVRKLDTARTLIRVDSPDADKVGIVTGGGSGHKPAFIGFIGRGMLDAVAVGEIFTSPPPLACFEAAKAANAGKGVLFLLGNYAGDVMNFQLAADMAKAEGIAVEQVILTDDVGSGPKHEAHKRRGVVGAFFAWKVSGAKAATGGSLEACKAAVEKVNANTRTLGVAISPCTVPAKGSPTFTLADDEMEYAVGHHGEAGTAKIKMMRADEITEKMTLEVIDDLPFRCGDEVAVLINGLGGTPQLELYICYRKVRRMLDERQISIWGAYVGEFFTGLEMAGFSVTLMKLDDELKILLAAPADTPYYKI